MSEPFLGSAHVRKDQLFGDVYPSNFQYGHENFDNDLKKIWQRTYSAQLLIDWMPYEAFRQGITFLEDEGVIEGYKFGQPYKFKGYNYSDKNTGQSVSLTGFDEYLQWIKAFEEFILGVSFSRLYPEGALLVFLDDDPELIYPSMNKQGMPNDEIIWKANSDPQGYGKFKAFQPIQVDGMTGFEPASSDDAIDQNGVIKKWKLQIQNGLMKNKKTYIVDADRCVHLLWKKRDNSWRASSRLDGIANIAVCEIQTFEALTKRAHDLAGGILTFSGVTSEKEQKTLEAAMGSDLTHVDTVYLRENRSIEFVTPDLKASGEFTAIFEIFTKTLCRLMRVSQLILDGEHTGAGLGGNNNIEMLNSYSEIYQIQEHYRTDLEYVFYKLGKKNTSFIYNEILPEDMTAEDEMSGGQDSNGTGDQDNGKSTQKSNKSQNTQENQ